MKQILGLSFAIMAWLIIAPCSNAIPVTYTSATGTVFDDITDTTDADVFAGTHQSSSRPVPFPSLNVPLLMNTFQSTVGQAGSMALYSPGVATDTFVAGGQLLVDHFSGHDQKGHLTISPASYFFTLNTPGTVQVSASRMATIDFIPLTLAEGRQSAQEQASVTLYNLTASTSQTLTFGNFATLITSDTLLSNSGSFSLAGNLGDNFRLVLTVNAIADVARVNDTDVLYGSSLADPNGLHVALSVVPEPATGTLALLGLGLFALARRNARH